MPLGGHVRFIHSKRCVNCVTEAHNFFGHLQISEGPSAAPFSLHPSRKKSSTLSARVGRKFWKKEKALARSDRSLSDRLKVHALRTGIKRCAYKESASCNCHRIIIAWFNAHQAPDDCNHVRR